MPSSTTSLRLLAILACLLLPVRAVAQDHLGHGASGLPHGIPDFCALAIDRLVIPANTATIIPAGTNRACIGVQGIATVPSGARIDVDNLLVSPGGALFVEAGAEIVFRGNPLDVTTDPDQFGEGLIAFGDVTMRGLVNGQPTIRIHSAKLDGVRGHLFLTGRGDTLIEGTITEDLGRTDASRPVDDTTYSGETVTHLGTNPKGRYGGWHLHHRFGPLPGSGKPYQFVIRQNRMRRGGKWGGVIAHNSSFGLIEQNDCRQATICYVEEDGSETANQWIGNYAGQAIGAPCLISPSTGTDYDPEGRCPAGFWLRAMHQVLRNNTVEDMQRGIAWWTMCLETNVPPCGSEALITIPKFPGADTTDPAQRQTCQWEGRDYPCHPNMRRGMAVDRNTIRRATIGIESWWTGRIFTSLSVVSGDSETTSPPITNTRTEDVAFPIHPHYSDLAFDGFTATGCTVFVTQFNDFFPAVNVKSEARIDHATATCSEAIYKRSGQLAQAPAWRFLHSTFASPKGLLVTLGGQGNGANSLVTVEDSTFVGGPIFTTAVSSQDLAPAQTITLQATRVNGQTFTRTLSASGLDAPLPDVGTVVEPPPVVVPPAVVTPPAPVCRDHILTPAITLRVCQ